MTRFLTDIRKRAGNVRAFSDTGRRILPGFLIATAAALAAMFAANLVGGPAPLHALALGLLAYPLARGEAYASGLAFVAGPMLRLAIVTLGARVSLHEVTELGALPIILILATIFAGIGFSVWLARRLGLETTFGWISGMGVAICGVSAAIAATSVLRPTPATQRSLVFVSLAVTVLSTIAMVAYPLLAHLFGLSPAKEGIFLGATIHDLAQVIGAGFSVSDQVGEVAVVTKLIRISMLVPVITVVSLLFLDRSGGGSFPWFFVGFLGLSALRSLNLLPDALAVLPLIGGFVFLMAIAAVGMKTRWSELLEPNWRPWAVTTLHTLLLVAVVLAVLRMS